MPEYLAPGVFVEEVSYRSKSIQGVGTSVAGIVGPTNKGPLRGTPEVLTSYGDFTRVYGDASPLTLGGTSVPNYTALAAKAFFDNGGKQLYVARVIKDVNKTDDKGSGGSAEAAARSDANNKLTISSRFPGASGRYTLELRWRESENLLSFENTTLPKDKEVLFLDAKYTAAADLPAGSSAVDDDMPITIKAVVKRSGDDLTIVDGNVLDKDGADISGKVGTLKHASLVSGAKLTRVVLRSPASGKVSDGAHAHISLSAQDDISDYTGASHWGSLTTLAGTFESDADGNPQFKIESDLNDGVGADATFSLAALVALSGGSASAIVQRNFDLDVRSGGINGEVVYSVGDISTAASGDNCLEKALPVTPASSSDQRTQPIAADFANGVTDDDVFNALYNLFDPKALDGDYSPIKEPRYIIQINDKDLDGTTNVTGTFSGGIDGDVPTAGDYRGEIDEVKGNTGLASFEQVEDISIVATPAAAAHADTHQAVVAEVQAHCRKMRYRVGVVDAQKGMSISEVRDFASNFDDSRLAIYYPWVVMSDPTGASDELTVPPGGFVAGVYAGTDVNRGVHKPPANEVVIGALRFAQEINQFQQELLNPNGINCLRSFPGRGHRVWGGRTMASDPEWKYVNVRRYFLYLERSIDKSCQWVVFEPNGDLLWRNVRNTIEDFLYSEWVNGRLLGGKASDAYFVRCDRSTMTQADLDNGRLVCQVGVAALKPAEFVIFRIGQKTADA